MLRYALVRHGFSRPHQEGRALEITSVEVQPRVVSCVSWFRMIVLWCPLRYPHTPRLRTPTKSISMHLAAALLPPLFHPDLIRRAAGCRHRVSERSVYRAGVRGELWTASREARLVLYRQLLAYSEAMDDGITLQVCNLSIYGIAEAGGSGGTGSMWTTGST